MVKDRVENIKMLNFLFCYDSNYNKQAEVAMYSILENVSEKININIIHQTDKVKNLIPDIIKEHRNLSKLIIYEFKRPKNIKFENLANVHVTEATYYRLFISNYLDKSINNLVYVDCDIVCVDDLTLNLKNKLLTLNKSQEIIAAVPEYKNIKEIQLFHNELKLKNNDYFNAGVMLIDFKKWNKNNVGSKLLETLISLKGKIQYWDQDVMNKFFDGHYLKLEDSYNKKFTNNNELNRKIISDIEDNNSDIFLIHFAGKFKPWHVNGAVVNGSELFHNIFYKLNTYQPYIQIYNRRNALKQLVSLKFIKDLKIKKNKFSIIFNVFRSIMFKGVHKDEV